MTLHEDAVRLVIGGEELAITENYEVREGIINQPGSFSLRLGTGSVARELISKFPPVTQFQLFIQNSPIQYGFTDGFSTGDGNGATQVTFEGYDLGARVTDAFINSELSFAADKTYLELLNIALDAVGLSEALVFTNNDGNRKSHAGSIVVVTAPTITQVTIDDGSSQEQIVPGTSQTVYQTIKAKLGTTWGEFLKKQFDRAGLFWWADGSGNFVLSAPNASQDPLYRIVRRRGITNAPVNVTRASFHNKVKRRYTKCSVWGHGGGRNFGRTKAIGSWVDPEMSKLLGGDDVKPLNIHDNHVRTPAQAQALARRKIAEANRDGYQLNYTLAGHTAPTLGGGADARAVWTPDTMVEVDDDELGLKRLFYVESCTHSRSSQTTTTVHLMRPEDLIFENQDSE